MASAAYLARLQIRRRWRSLTVLALLIAVIGGIAISLIAGSRRSSSVVERYFGAAIPYDLQVGVYASKPSESSDPTLSRDALRKIPGVVRADPDVYFATTLVRPDGTLGDGVNGLIYDRVGVDPTFRVLAGRIPPAGDRSTVIVNEGFVKQFGLHVGDRMTVRAFARSDWVDVYSQRFGNPHGPEYQFRIGAVIRTPLDIVLDEQKTVRDSSYGNSSGMFVPDSFYEANRKDVLAFADAYDVQFDNPTRRKTFEESVRRLTADGDNVPYFGPARFAERASSFDTPVQLETAVLLALGLATALAGAIVTAILLRAERRSHEHDAVVLRALGATRNQLGLAAMVRTAPFAAFGALGAFGIACALSGRFPVGVGHLLELDRGFDINVAVLATATAIAFALTISLAFVVELRVGVAPRSRPARVRGGIDHVLARNGAPVEIVVGSHLAFDRGEPRRRVPSRPAIAGGAVAVAVVVALGVMLASADHLYKSGDAHGWAWDAVLGNTNFNLSKARETQLVADRRLTAATRGRYGQATVGGVSTEVLAYDPGGDAPPVILSGRLPRAADEIAPGAKLLRELHAKVGEKVKLSIAGGEFESDASSKDLALTVVGVSIPPILGESDFGEGAVVPLATIRAAHGITDPQLVLARLRGSNVRATAKGLEHDYIRNIVLDTVPSRVVNVHRVRSLLILGALLAAALGAVLLAYTLAVGVRARTRELAVLRALGMTPPRVGRVLVWQGVALALAVATIGIPAGLLLGSIAWRAMADAFGVSATPTINGLLLFLVPATIAVGVAASLVPARRARRVDVSQLLHAE